MNLRRGKEAGNLCQIRQIFGSGTRKQEHNNVHRYRKSSWGQVTEVSAYSILSVAEFEWPDRLFFVKKKRGYNAFLPGRAEDGLIRGLDWNIEPKGGRNQNVSQKQFF
jgi:hypothetical protein